MKFLDIFRRIPIPSRVRDALHQASLDLLDAEAILEEAEARRDYLRRRVARLSNYPKESPHESDFDTHPGVRGLGLDRS